MSAWTSELPVKEGWYWWQSEDCKPCILHLGITCRDFEGSMELCTDYSEDQETPSEMGGEWQGPLEPLP